MRNHSYIKKHFRRFHSTTCHFELNETGEGVLKKSGKVVTLGVQSWDEKIASSN